MRAFPGLMEEDQTWVTGWLVLLFPTDQLNEVSLGKEVENGDHYLTEVLKVIHQIPDLVTLEGEQDSAEAFPAVKTFVVMVCSLLVSSLHSLLQVS